MNTAQPIIALDFGTLEETLTWLDALELDNLNVKVGMELFYSAGPAIVHEIKQRHHKIFLDLKLFDIPNTIEKAMYQLAKLGIDMVNVHATGGVQMMKAARKGLEAGTPPGSQRPLLIAVTQLTSTTEKQMQDEQLLRVSLRESVLNYAQLANQAGLDGVVCSPHEASMISDHIGEKFITVCPGIRPNVQNNQDDQKRIMTPEQAAQAGCSYIVVGRPITQADDPKSNYLDIQAQWQKHRGV